MNRILYFGLLFLAVSGCRNKETASEVPEAAEIPDTLSVKKEHESTDKTGTYTSPVLEIENVRVNHHKVLLSKADFEATYKKIDSTKTALWECGNPFEWLDKEWMEKTYGKMDKEKGTFDTFNGDVTTLYAKGIEFNSNSHIVLFNTAFAEDNSLEILSHKILLDRKTTLEEFRKLFPNAEMEPMDTANEVRFRFYIKQDMDDAFLFFFKDGKLDSFCLWWLLC